MRGESARAAPTVRLVRAAQALGWPPARTPVAAADEPLSRHLRCLQAEGGAMASARLITRKDEQLALLANTPLRTVYWLFFLRYLRAKGAFADDDPYRL